MAAYDRFAGLAFPTDAEEIWRYSRIGALHLGDYDAPRAERSADGVPAVAQFLLDEIGERDGLIVTTNGQVTHVEEPKNGALLGGLSSHSEFADLLGAVATSSESLLELALAFLVDAAVVLVDAVVERPIVVVHVVEGDPAASRPVVFPRTIVTVGPNGRAAVVELHVSNDVAAFVAPVAELSVADGADLSFHSLQQLGPRVFAVAHQASTVGRDAHLRSFTAALGGWYARCRTDSRLVGQGGSSELLAAFFGEGEQMHDFRTLQEHAAPRTTSDLLFKGAVGDTARSVYSGMIRIHPGAKGSKAFQTNRNLVLSEGAHADSVPNLDIQENDVRCSHASAVGPIDPDHRYYLESRGVRPEAADRLILLGFFDDLFARVTVPGIRGHLVSEVATRLGQATREAES
jgi:Fe-S cluster assembly protein SufD